MVCENPDGNLCDPGHDWRPLVEAAAGTPARVFASVYSHLNSDRLSEAPIAMVRAAAANAWAQGVDGLYVNQWFYNWPYDASFYEKLRELPFAEVLAPRDKSYWVPGGGPERLEDGAPPPQLPLPLAAGGHGEVCFEIADDVAGMAAAGRLHSCLLRLRLTGATEQDRLRVSLNGVRSPMRPSIALGPPPDPRAAFSSA